MRLLIDIAIIKDSFSERELWCSRSLYVVVRPPVYNVCAPYPVDWNFRQCF